MLICELAEERYGRLVRRAQIVVVSRFGALLEAGILVLRSEEPDSRALFMGAIQLAMQHGASPGQPGIDNVDACERRHHDSGDLPCKFLQIYRP
jgi:hypothetical protein